MSFNDVFKPILLLLLGAYRTLGVIFFGGSCRFHPSCSEYAVEAVKTKSVPRALQLILFRLLRCHPWGDCGFDPVPSDKRGLNGQ